MPPLLLPTEASKACCIFCSAEPEAAVVTAMAGDSWGWFIGCASKAKLNRGALHSQWWSVHSHCSRSRHRAVVGSRADIVISCCSRVGGTLRQCSGTSHTKISKGKAALWGSACGAASPMPMASDPTPHRGCTHRFCCRSHLAPERARAQAVGAAAGAGAGTRRSITK